MRKQKEKVPVVNLYLDTRREKAEGNYPVKLRVYFDYKTRMYFMGKDLTEDEFSKSYLGEKPRDEYKTLKRELLAYELKAVEIIENLSPFNFDHFEKLMSQPHLNGAKQQHYVPRFYLAGFARQNQLAVFDRRTGATRMQTPEHTAC